jgi:NTF2 fold immunity protein
LKKLFILTILFAQIACGQTHKNRTSLELNFAKQELAKAVQDTNSRHILVDTIIKDSETAIQVSEAILFKIYGKKNILKQKPYEINILSGYWVLNGTLPKNTEGGTFLIIISALTGQVIKLTHGK